MRMTRWDISQGESGLKPFLYTMFHHFFFIVVNVLDVILTSLLRLLLNTGKQEILHDKKRRSVIIFFFIENSRDFIYVSGLYVNIKELTSLKLFLSMLLVASSYVCRSLLALKTCCNM